MLKVFRISVFKIVLLLTVTGPTYAQPNFTWFQNFTFEKGLPFNKECFTLFQDEKGFIWMGSDMGLHRFDGHNFRNYIHQYNDSSSIRKGFVNVIFSDSKNNTWIGTSTGADIFIEEHNKFIHVPMYDNNIFVEINQSVRGFFENNAGELFLYTHFFIYRYFPESKYFMRTDIGLTQHQPEGFVIEGIVEEENYLICATNNQGIVIYNSEGKKVKNLNPDLESHVLKGVFESSNSQIWIASEKGINVADSFHDLTGQKTNVIKSVPGANGIIINNITEDRKGNIWAATDGYGIFQINPQSLEIKEIEYNPDTEGSVLSNKTALVYVDNQNNLWSFYNNYGFSVANLNHSNIFHTHTSRNPTGNCPSGNIITAIAQDGDGNIWIGTDGDGLNLFNRETGNFKHFKAESNNPFGLSSNVILSLFVDSDNQLWIGTYNGGLCKYNKKSNQIEVFKNDVNPAESFSSNNISAIAEDDDGNLFVLTISNGLNILNKKTGEIKQIHSGVNDDFKLSHNGGTCLLKDSDGNIWVGTYWGLNKIETKTQVIRKFFHAQGDSASISSDVIECIFEDSKKNIWIATTNGLTFFDKTKGRFKNFGTSDGLPNQHITSIIEDNHQNLWIGSHNGISKMNLDDFKIKNYGFNYNLPGKIMLPRSVMKAQNGELYFGGNRGFTYFNPNHKTFTDFFPNLYLTELRVLDRLMLSGEKLNKHVILKNDISETGKLVLNHNEKSFSITFTALDYANILKINYYYLLEGFDDTWRKADNATKTAVYTNLDAGKYRFKVKMVSGLDELESEPITMDIKVLSPLWLRWWAFLVYFIIISIITGVFLQISRARIKLKRFLQIEKIQHEHDLEISKIKDDFYTKVTHEFRTPLTLVLGPLEQIREKYKSDNYLAGQLILIKRNVTRLLLLINELLDFGKIENAGIQVLVSEMNIVDYFKQVANNFEAHARIHKINFEVKSDSPEIKVWFDKNKLDKVFYNLLSNAFKFTEDNGAIKCNIAIKEQFVSIIVKDNGIGIPGDDLKNIFTKYFSASNSGNQFSTGIGLYLSKEIVLLHKGTISAKNNSGKGCSFEVLLPLGNSHFTQNEIQVKEIRSDEYFPLVTDDDDSQVIVEENFLKNTENEENRSVILIVEDNPDVRTFIKCELEKNYEILEASNGQHGLEIAFEKIPDLVVSDIMMPGLDGRSLCFQLKNDERTSHIPIILLTALSDIENRIEGLDLGADSYITKPFHPKHLIVRVKKLLQLRKVLHEKYNRQIDQVQIGLNYEPQEIEKASVDEQFMQRLIEIVEKHMSDSNFELDDLCNEVGMKYLQLYRKVKAITNLTLKQFIMTIKMKTAAKMIETRKFNISEVAYDVGFSSPAYFSESFRKYFGMTPTEYLQKTGG
jgi:signal transduction histidine kinase/ligand-binding sensor domain-containing protein/DNA-binding response OmpR family regulator